MSLFGFTSLKSRSINVCCSQWGSIVAASTPLVNSSSQIMIRKEHLVLQMNSCFWWSMITLCKPLLDAFPLIREPICSNDWVPKQLECEILSKASIIFMSRNYGAKKRCFQSSLDLSYRPESCLFLFWLHRVEVPVVLIPSFLLCRATGYMQRQIDSSFHLLPPPAISLLHFEYLTWSKLFNWFSSAP